MKRATDVLCPECGAPFDEVDTDEGGLEAVCSECGLRETWPDHLVIDQLEIEHAAVVLTGGEVPTTANLAASQRILELLKRRGDAPAGDNSERG